MRFTKFSNQTHIPLFTALFFLSLIFYLACNSGGGGSKPAAETAVLTSAAPSILVQPGVPSDITGGAPNATLMQAAVFAWQEFIALNWPALPGFRDSANVNANFGGPNDTVLVWHTFRNKVEIFTAGNNTTPPGYNPQLPDYGYNSGPQYFYLPGASGVGTKNGLVNPCNTASKSTPWVNLDENNEIGVTTMYAGIGTANAYPGPQILFLAKANKAEYMYAAKRKWYNGDASFLSAAKNTATYIANNGRTPPTNSDTTLVSLPSGTIEIKTGWRRLTQAEQQSGRFYTTKVRYYNQNGKYPCYVDDVLGMVALHIIHKTPTAPYFVFATFEQTDNILTTGGKAVEDADGNVIANKDSLPLNPNFQVTNATPTTLQTFSPDSATSKPGSSLFYQNITNSGFNPYQPSGIPGGTVTINKRMNAIPKDVIAVNKAAHDAITAYNQQNHISNSPWLFYKLVNVQYKPINKPNPGGNYSLADSATYYQSNSVVESDYILQRFSGKFSTLNANGTGDFTITDYKNTAGALAINAYNNQADNKGKYSGSLMGGCMGCHGNATNGGTDYSFIFGGQFPQTLPEVAGKPIDLNSSKNKNLKALLKRAQ